MASLRDNLPEEYASLLLLLKYGIDIKIDRPTLHKIVDLAFQHYQDIINGKGEVRCRPDDPTKLFKRQFMGRLGEYVAKQLFQDQGMQVNWDLMNHYGIVDISLSDGRRYDCKCSNFNWLGEGNAACPQINLNKKQIPIVLTYVGMYPNDEVFDYGIDAVKQHLEIRWIRTIAIIDDINVIKLGCDPAYGWKGKNGFVRFSSLNTLTPREE